MYLILIPQQLSLASLSPPIKNPTELTSFDSTLMLMLFFPMKLLRYNDKSNYEKFVVFGSLLKTVFHLLRDVLLIWTSKLRQCYFFEESSFLKGDNNKFQNTQAEGAFSWLAKFKRLRVLISLIFRRKYFLGDWGLWQIRSGPRK